MTVHADLICRATDDQSVLFSLGTDTPAIKVTPGIPVGTVLFSKNFEFSTSCSLNKVMDREKVIYFKRKNLTQALGYGLTLNISFNGNDGSSPQTISTGVSVNDHTAVGGGTTATYWPKNKFSIDVKIVKTSNSTQPAANNASVILFTMGDSATTDSDSAVFRMNNPNSIIYTTETCKISGAASFTVDLGKTTLNEANGFGSEIGSNSKSKDFSINLTCDTDINSTFKIMMQLDGTSPVSGGSSGLLSLSPGANNAQGVALQILFGGTDKPVSFGKPWQIGAFPVSGSEINVPFSVRYYQTDKKVTPGTASSTMIYTVSYI